MSAGLFKVSEQVLSAAVNGVYQGVIIALLVGLALRFLVRTNAATRHAVWFGVLLLVAALIPAHLFLDRLQQQGASIIESPSPAPAAARAPTYSGSRINLPVAEYQLAPTQQLADSDDPETAAAPADDDRAVKTSFESSSTQVSDQTDSNKGERIGIILGRYILKALTWKPQTAVNFPRPICICAICAWIVLAMARGGLLAARIIQMRRIKRESRPPSVALQSLFASLYRKVGVRRRVQLRTSSAHPTALVLGFLNPVVLLPETMDNDSEGTEAEHVLRHELAHVERLDDWGDLTQQIIEAGLFFHPAVWWISRRLSLEREIACDDHVLEAGDRPQAYALTLANVACRMNQSRLSLAPGVSNNNSQLQQRISMILNTQRDRSPRLARSRLGLFTAAAAVLAVLAINAGPRLVLAESTSSESATTTVAPTPELAAADAAPATPPDPADPSGPDSAPRPKDPAGDDSVTPRPVSLDSAPEAPEPPAPMAIVAGVAPMNPAPPMVAIAPPAPAAVSVRPVDWSDDKKHGSIEERLDRIERILDELQGREKMRGMRHGPDGKTDQGPKHQDFPMAMNLNLDISTKIAEQTQRAMEQAQRAVEAGQRAAEQGQRAAERAMREAEKAAEHAQRDAEKGSREGENAKNEDMQRMLDLKRRAEADGPQMELQALRAARESLQQEVKNLEHQIKHLEEQRDGLKKRAESDDSDHGPKDEAPGPNKS